MKKGPTATTAEAEEQQENCPHGQQKMRPYPAPARTSWGSKEGAGSSGQVRRWRQRAS